MVRTSKKKKKEENTKKEAFLKRPSYGIRCSISFPYASESDLELSYLEERKSYLAKEDSDPLLLSWAIPMF